MRKSVWDRYAPIYRQAMRGDAQAYRFMYGRIAQVVRGKEVLELATGPGLLARHVAPAARRMVATDYSEGMVREARKGPCPANLSFEVADAARLPYGDGTFDVTIVANALHVMDDPNKALAEVRRVLRPGGLLVAPNFVNHSAGNPLWRAILKAAGVSFEHRWTDETYPAYLESQGWEVAYSKLMPARIAVMYVECSARA